MRILPDLNASTGKYIQTSIPNAGNATYTITVPHAGDYVIWCRVLAPSFHQDSFFVSMDDGPEDIYDAAEQSWSGVWQRTRVNGRGGTDGRTPLRLNPRIFHLSEGVHQLLFKGREITCLDFLIITDDLAFVQSDDQPPAPPADLAAIAGDQQVSLRWSP